MKPSRICRERKGFSLIELIVVMAVMAVLVLVAAPRYLRFTDQADLARITADVKTVDAKVCEYMVRHEDGIPDNGEIVCADELAEAAAGGSVYNAKGEAQSPDGAEDYYVLQEDFIKGKAGSKLANMFICDSMGNVYYVDAILNSYKVAVLNTVYNTTVGGKAMTLKGLADGSVAIDPTPAAAISGAVEIPFKQEGYRVSALVNSAFAGSTGLTSVVLPDTVKDLGTNTFRNCVSLASVDLPDKVTAVGANAFAYCTSLTTVVIPASVTSIGEYAFDGWESGQTICFEAEGPAGITFGTDWSGTATVVYGYTGE